MNNWSVNNFPKLKAFCEENLICFSLNVTPVECATSNVFLDLRFDYGYRTYKHRLVRDTIDNIKCGSPAFENAMIDRLKKNFRIETEIPSLWESFTKPLLFNTISSDLSLPALRSSIKDVMFNDPATIVFWNDGTKTVVKAENEVFDPEKGLAMAIVKKVLGNEGNYYNIFKQWIPSKEVMELDQYEDNCDTCIYKDRESFDEPCHTCIHYDEYVKAKTEQENNNGR